jgi:2-keto-4-pentenoate hydratase/2-oxohepta-3-ene-1,7-dioic acid hydratase in catechol pathway
VTERPRPTKIVCVGRNYVKHAEELGNVVPERPLLFLKPPSAVVVSGEAILRPADSARVDHEGEIGVEIGERCRHVREGEALAYVAGYRALNDVTARDLQEADDQWSRAKGFDTFCPLGPLAPGEGVDPSSIEVVCRVDGAVRQRGRAAEMAFSIPFLVHYISRIMTLEPGDVIATGTPEGVGPLRAGMDVEVELRAGDELLSAVRNTVADERG